VSRIGHEWKNIYRQCSAFDVMREGQIPISQFNKACIKFSVLLSKDELRRISVFTIGNPERMIDGISVMSPTTEHGLPLGTGEVNYLKLSKLLGLHNGGLDRIVSSPSANLLVNKSNLIAKIIA